jgi:hypothetical protein
MRFISLMLSLCLTFNVMAHSGTIQELERSFDEYHYSLSVEWDQQDPAFLEQQTALFFNQLKKLIQEQGLSVDEIRLLMESKVNDKAALAALKLKLNLMGPAASVEDMVKVIRESAQDFYTRGASWNGGVIISMTVGLLIAAAIGYAIWWNANHVCVASELQYTCYTHNNCYPNHYGTYCGPSYTSCGWSDVCTRYARKN